MTPVPPFNKENDYILFFTPEAEVVPHLALQCVIASNLQQLGYKVLFAFCPGLVCRCPSMDMHSLSFSSPEENRAKVCNPCQTKFQAIVAKYNLPWVSLGDCVTPDQVAGAKVAVSQSPEARTDFYFHDVPVGKIALGDYAIGTKNWCTDRSDPDAVKGWEQYAESIIINYLAVDTLCQKLPIKRIVRYNDYANNMAASFAGKKNGIPVFSICHAAHRGGVDLQRLIVFPKLGGLVLKDELETWPLWRSLALSSTMVEEIASDVYSRFSSKSLFTYSPAKSHNIQSLRTTLGLHDGKKLLVAFTSSAEEIMFLNNLLDVSGYVQPDHPQAFQNHVEWLRCIVDHAEQSEDIELVVRIHPREGRNERYPKPSSHLATLQREFGGHYKNTKIIWPDDKTSSYDLMEIADLGLTSWSTIGIEMARVGIPVVTAFQKVNFPEDDFMRWGGPTKEDYLRTVREQLHWMPSIDSIARAYRCYFQSRLGSAICLADVIPDKDFRGLPEINGLAKESSTLVSTFIDMDDILDINRTRLRSLGINTQDEEKRSICAALQAMIAYLLLGPQPALLPHVRVVRSASPQLPDPQSIVIEPGLKENYLIIRQGEERAERFSPLAYRLVQVLENGGVLSNDAATKQPLGGTL